jgi:hypothetical protein
MLIPYILNTFQGFQIAVGVTSRDGTNPGQHCRSGDNDYARREGIYEYRVCEKCNDSSPSLQVSEWLADDIYTSSELYLRASGPAHNSLELSLFRWPFNCNISTQDICIKSAALLLRSREIPVVFFSA